MPICPPRRLNCSHEGRDSMRYLMLIYGDEAVNAARNEAEQAANMDAWMSYTVEFEKSGMMLGGEALLPTTAATSVRARAGGGTITSDGPFVETKEALGGYYLIDAPSIEEAIAWAGKM